MLYFRVIITFDMVTLADNYVQANKKLINNDVKNSTSISNCYLSPNRLFQGHTKACYNQV